jgi:GAF domain
VPDRPVADDAARSNARTDGRGGFSVEWQLSGWAPGPVLGFDADAGLVCAASLAAGPGGHVVTPAHARATGPAWAPRRGRERRSGLDVVDLAGLDDPHRLGRLRSLDLLDRPARPNLDRLVRLACDLLDAPIGLVSVVDRDRQFFLAAHGLPALVASARQTSLDYSICKYPVASGRPLIVGDTRAEPLLAVSPAVTEMGVLAYAGIPLVDPQGQPLATFCVIDVRARDWDDALLAILARLAQIATEVCVGDRAGIGFEEECHVASAGP